MYELAKGMQFLPGPIKEHKSVRLAQPSLRLCDKLAQLSFSEELALN